MDPFLNQPETTYNTSKEVYGSALRATKINPAVNPSTTLSATATTNVQFELPNATIGNLSKSTLEFRLSFADVAGQITRMHSFGMSPIRSVKLGAVGNKAIHDVQDVDKYTRAVYPLLMPAKEFQSHEANRGVDAVSVISGRGFNAYPSGANSGTTIPAGASKSAGNSVRIGLNTLAGDVPTVQSADMPVIEPQYFTSANSDDLIVAFSIPLKWLLPHSFMSLNESLPWPDQTRIDIQFNSLDRMVWQQPDADQATFANYASYAGTCSFLEPPTLQYQMETNPIIIENIREMMASPQGFQVNVADVVGTRRAIASGTSHNVQTRVNNSNGMRLLNTYTAVFASSADSIRQADLSNASNDNALNKVLTLRTKLNTLNLQEDQLDASLNEDYRQMKRHLDGSLAYNSDVWRYNRCYVDSWRGVENSVEWLDADKAVDGIDVRKEEKIYDVTHTTPAKALDVYVWHIVQRKFAFQAGGAVVEM